MFHYNIRGGLGTQVLQFVNVYADALEKGLTDDRLEITLNFGNYDDWFYSNPGNHIVDLDFISLLFDFEPFPNYRNLSLILSHHLIKNMYCILELRIDN